MSRWDVFLCGYLVGLTVMFLIWLWADRKEKRHADSPTD